MGAPIIHRDIAQHSPEWFAIKAGKWSASKAGVIMGGLDTSGLDALVKDIAWERVYGPTEGGFQSEAMKRGNDLEFQARDWYAFERDAIVEEVGFVQHASIPMVGWSPDGMIGTTGAIEAKCPLHKAWMEVKRTRRVPAEYRWQCRWAMWVGALDGLDFVAFHPQAGGLIVPCEVTESERDQMAARVTLLEARVAEWIDILNDKKEAA